jgi:type II secretory pathway component GspD/PulD (secretin)
MMRRPRNTHAVILLITYSVHGLFLPALNVSAEEALAESPVVPAAQIASSAPSHTRESLISDEFISGGMEGRVSLDLRNIDVVEALKYLAMKASANIIATKNVAGRVTLMVENVAVKDVFDIMLRSNGLAYSKERDIYNVMTEEEYKALFGKKFSDIREVKIFKLNYAIPEQAFSMLDALKSDIGRVLVEPDSGTTLVMDAPGNMREIEKALAKMEEKNLIQVFVLKYAKAKEVEEQLKAQLDAKKVGFVKADERSNQLIVQALPGRMPDIERLIKAMDGKTKEVLIDTTIVKIQLSDTKTEGIEWEGLGGLGAQLGMMYLGSTPFSVLQTATSAAATAFPSRQSFLETSEATRGLGAGIPFSGNANSNLGGGAVTPGEVLHTGLVSKNYDLDLLIRYLKTIGKTQVLSNPKIAVVNNQEARIHIGERQAYVTTTTTTGQTTSTVSEEVTFVDVGIQMAVTPTVNDDGYITMKVKPEISSVVSTLITPSNNKIPIIDTSMAETTVMVKDGYTIVIGGLRKDEKTSASDGIPYLSDIPVLGLFFKSGTNTKVRTELIIMMTPHIISGDGLTTGDDRDLMHKPGKGSQDYKKLTADTDFEKKGPAPDKMIKPYMEYSDLWKEPDEKPNIKE